MHNFQFWITNFKMAYLTCFLSEFDDPPIKMTVRKKTTVLKRSWGRNTEVLHAFWIVSSTVLVSSSLCSPKLHLSFLIDEWTSGFFSPTVIRHNSSLQNNIPFQSIKWLLKITNIYSIKNLHTTFTNLFFKKVKNAYYKNLAIKTFQKSDYEFFEN